MKPHEPTATAAAPHHGAGHHGTSRRGAPQREVPALSPNPVSRLTSALGGVWLETLRGKTFGVDIVAGLTVAAVALPLNLALAVASGLPPEAGLFAGAIGGAIAAILGGSAYQATGPAAALSVMVLAIAKQHGAEGVAAAAILVGIIQIALSWFGAGRLVALVPESVLAGFTTGVGLKLLDSQVPELLGFDYKVVELAQMLHRPQWLHEVSLVALVSGGAVMLLVSMTKQWRRFPAALVGVGLVTLLSAYLGWQLERVGAVPSAFPSPKLPAIPDDKWLDILLLALPLGLLAAVESLLSARAVDRMVPNGRPHDADLELLGQGAANIGVGFFAGMPVSGVIVRSSVNVQSGGRSRLASLFHAIALFFAVVALSDEIARVPLAGLAGLLCMVAGRLIEVGTLIHLVREHKMGALAFAVAAGGTATGHLMMGLVGGIVVHLLDRQLFGADEKVEAEDKERRARGIRAVLGRGRADARRPKGWEPPPGRSSWLSNITGPSRMAPSSFVHHGAHVIGRVELGDHVHIAAGSSVRADEGTPFFIGANTNVQDGVVLHALKEKKVVVGGEEWAIYVGENVSLAHNALVHGPCYIGDGTFVGFKAVVHDSIVGPGCFIGIGAIVVGVEIPPGRFVPHGAVVTTQDAVDALGPASEAQTEFNAEVVDVNRGLAAAYREVFRGRSPGRAAGALAGHVPAGRAGYAFQGEADPRRARRGAVVAARDGPPLHAGDPFRL